MSSITMRAVLNVVCLVGVGVGVGMHVGPWLGLAAGCAILILRPHRPLP